MKLSVMTSLVNDFFFPNLAPGRSFAEIAANLRRYGLDAVEIYGAQLGARLPEVRAALRATGLEVSAIAACQPGCLLAESETERQTVLASLREQLHWAAELGAVGILFVPIFGRARLAPPPDGGRVETLELALLEESLAQLAELGGRLGVRVLIEPVNRYETHLFNRVEQVAELCQRLDSPWVRVIADFFHMNIEEVDLGETLAVHGQWVEHVHLVDSNRFLPGQGHTDFPPALGELKRKGYARALSFECFVRGEPDQVLPETVRRVRQVWEDA